MISIIFVCKNLDTSVPVYVEKSHQKDYLRVKKPKKISYKYKKISLNIMNIGN